MLTYVILICTTIFLDVLDLSFSIFGPLKVLTSIALKFVIIMVFTKSPDHVEDPCEGQLSKIILFSILPQKN